MWLRCPGVANPIVAEHLLDTPLSYEAMEQIGSGLGAGGFFVLDEQTDVAAVAYAATRFLAVESCGQCEPCKRDGLGSRGACTGRRGRGSFDQVGIRGDLEGVLTPRLEPERPPDLAHRGT